MSFGLSTHVAERSLKRYYQPPNPTGIGGARGHWQAIFSSVLAPSHLEWFAFCMACVPGPQGEERQFRTV